MFPFWLALGELKWNSQSAFRWMDGLWWRRTMYYWIVYLAIMSLPVFSYWITLRFYLFFQGWWKELKFIHNRRSTSTGNLTTKTKQFKWQLRMSVIWVHIHHECMTSGCRPRLTGVSLDSTFEIKFMKMRYSRPRLRELDHEFIWNSCSGAWYPVNTRRLC